MRQAIWIKYFNDYLYTCNIGLNNSVLSPIHMQTIARSSYVNNATLQYEYYNIYNGERVQVYSVRLRQNVSAEELKHNLESATAVISRVIVIRREGMYLVFIERTSYTFIILIDYIFMYTYEAFAHSLYIYSGH